MSRLDPVALALLLVAALVRGLFLAEVIGHDLEVRDKPNIDAYFYDYEARKLATDPLALHLNDPIPGRAVPGHRAFATTAFGAERVKAEIGENTFPDYPGYAYFVAAHYALFGPTTRVVLAVQELLDLATCALVYLIALRVADRTVARLALALTALGGPLVFYAGFLLRDSLIAFSYTLVVHLALRARERAATPAWLALGLAFGAAWVLKGSVLLLAPFCGPPLARRDGESRRERARRVLRAVGVVALGAATVVLPFAARNVAVGSAPFRMSSLEPPALLVYNAPGGATRGLAFDPALARRLGERCPRIGTVPALLTAIRAHASPLGWGALITTRVANYWIADDAWDNVRYSYLAPCLRSLRLAPVRFKLIAPFVAVGLVLLLADLRRGAPLLGPVFAVAAMSALGACLTRYRLHADPIHAILAASALVWMLREARRKRPRALYAALAAVAVSVALHDDPQDPRFRPTPERIRIYVISNFAPDSARYLAEGLGA